MFAVYLSENPDFSESKLDYYKVVVGAAEILINEIKARR